MLKSPDNVALGKVSRWWQPFVALQAPVDLQLCVSFAFHTTVCP